MISLHPVPSELSLGGCSGFRSVHSTSFPPPAPKAASWFWGRVGSFSSLGNGGFSAPPGEMLGLLRLHELLKSGLVRHVFRVVCAGTGLAVCWQVLEQHSGPGLGGKWGLQSDLCAS